MKFPCIVHFMNSVKTSRALVLLIAPHHLCFTFTTLSPTTTTILLWVKNFNSLNVSRGMLLKNLHNIFYLNLILFLLITRAESRDVSERVAMERWICGWSDLAGKISHKQNSMWQSVSVVFSIDCINISHQKIFSSLDAWLSEWLRKNANHHFSSQDAFLLHSQEERVTERERGEHPLLQKICYFCNYSSHGRDF